MNPMSRKAFLTVGGLATATSLVLSGGVASAATTPSSAAHPHAAGHVQRMVKREITRQTHTAGRLDRRADRLNTRAGKLTVKVDALADGTAKTDALAKLADLATQTAAVSTGDAGVLSALKAIDPTDVTAARATLKADRAVFTTSRADLHLARKDMSAIVKDLQH